MNRTLLTVWLCVRDKRDRQMMMHSCVWLGAIEAEICVNVYENLGCVRATLLRMTSNRNADQVLSLILKLGSWITNKLMSVGSCFTHIASLSRHHHLPPTYFCWDPNPDAHLYCVLLQVIMQNVQCIFILKKGSV